MNAGAISGGLYGRAGCVNVLWDTAGESRNDWSADFGCNFLHGFKIAVADDGKTCFDHVNV